MPATFAEPLGHRLGGEQVPHGFDDDEEEGGTDFGRYLAAVLRYKWLILGLSVLGLGAGYGLSKLVRPMFAAQATIAIDAGSSDRGPIQTSQLLESRAWLDLMRSFQVLDEVVRRRHLYIETASPTDAALFTEFTIREDFRPGSYTLTADATGNRVSLVSDAGTVLETVATGDSLGAAFGFVWQAPQMGPGQVVAFTVRTPRDAAVRLGENLGTVLPPENAAFIRLTLRGEDPVATALTLNALADRFVEYATILKRTKLTTNAEVLSDQLASSYADLRAAESRLESFKIGAITEASEAGTIQLAPGLTETRDPVRNAFFQLRIDRDALVRDRDAILRALRTASDSGAMLLVSLGTIPSVTSSAELAASLATLGSKRSELRAMLVEFAPTHLPVQALQREVTELEERTIPRQANVLVQGLNQRISDFDDRINASSREMRQIPARASEQARLERNLEIAQSLYTQLRSSYEEAILAERSASPDVRVLDRAVPPTTPLTDQLLMIVAGGLVGGFGLGLVLAVLLDKFDRRLRYPDQVTKDLGLTILGAIPLMKKLRDGTTSPHDDAQLVEALRSIRMSLTYAHGTAGAFITTVTSPGPGDGKSFISANLAKSFASSGHRTLLIDGDTRRGHLHRTLGLQRRPGLLDLLSGSARREDVIQKAPAWGIDVITCGTRDAGGPEMLASADMAQLIMSLRNEYTAIIIDSPPLGAGVDPMVLAALSGSMVMVLRSGVTDRELAATRMHDLTRLPIRILGAVLNDVSPQGVYRYYSYLPGYRAEDEVSAGPTAPAKRKLLGKK